MKLYDILELQKLTREELTEVAKFYEIPIAGKFKQPIIYEILDKQTINSIFDK